MHLLSLVVAIAAPLAAGVPTPTISDKNADPHFLTGVYGMLRTSGNRVGDAAQQVLNVQGSLDDLKEDLHTEYDRWQKQHKDLASKRDELVSMIQAHQSSLLEQRSLQALAERLKGDLVTAGLETKSVVDKHEHDSEEWKKQQLDLKKDIQDVQKEIGESAIERQRVLNATRNRTDAILARQRMVEEETLKLNEAVRKTKSVRDQHTANTSTVESELLAQTTAVRRLMGDVKISLQGQASIALEESRLASQADAVAARRAQIDAQMKNCTTGISEMDSQVAQAAKDLDQATASLKNCQEIDARNQEIQAKISACRAEGVAGR